MPEHQQTQQSKKTNTIFQNQATPVVQTPASNPYSIIQRAKINPRSLTRADIMQLHRTIGNQAVGRLLSSIGSSSTAQQATVQRQEMPEEEKCSSCMQRQEIPEEEEPLQGKMTETLQRQEIPEEEEPLQGKMIETVQMQEIPEEEPLQGKMIETIQRQEIPEEDEPLQGKFEGKPEEKTCPSCMQRQEIPEEEEPLQGKLIEPIQRQEIPEEEEPLQGKFENKPDQMACPSCFVSPIVQRQEIPEEEEPLQGKMIETIQRQEIPEEEEPLQGKFESIQRQEIPEEEEPLQTKRENNTGMPDNLKAGVESLSGIDMSDVRVHYNSSKPPEVGALAYTQGTNIHVASGQEKHLPHEAWHVVQQKHGRVSPTMQLKDGVLVNDDEGMEHEADVMGAKSLQMWRGDIVTSRPIAQETNAEPRESKQTVVSEATDEAVQIFADRVPRSDSSVGMITGHLIQAQRIEGTDVIQAYRRSRAPDGGTIIGEPAGCHCHIEIGNPHFKVGNDQRTRINFGRDMQQHLMQRAYEALITEHMNKPGYQDCKDYLEEQGCHLPPIKTLVEIGAGQGRYPPILQPGQQWKDENGNIHTK